MTGKYHLEQRFPEIGEESCDDAGKQVWDTILKREAAAMGHFQVCDDSAAPCDDPEDQMVVAVSSWSVFSATFLEWCGKERQCD